MKKKKLTLRSEVIAVLNGRQLANIFGAVITQGDSDACTAFGCGGTGGPPCTSDTMPSVFTNLCDTVGCSTGPICTNSGGGCGPSWNVPCG